MENYSSNQALPDQHTHVHDLFAVPYSQEYRARLLKAAGHLREAAELADSHR